MAGKRRARVVRMRAFAKINLSLQVVARRRDGYHDLRTVLQSLALHDTLTFRTTRGPFRISCDDEACPIDEANLVWKAAERVWAAAHRRGAPRGVDIRITKRIPLEAGLGGGSSDAAAAIQALSALWRVELNRDRMRKIAAALGADVAYFLEGGTVLALERGDLLFPMEDSARAWVVLLIPPFGVRTKDAYGWWDRRHARRARLPLARRARADVDSPRSGNDLQTVVAARHPEIARMVAALQRAGAGQAAMSGSGSAVFGLFARRTDATRAASGLARRGLRVILTATLGRSRYRRLRHLPAKQRIV